MGDDDVAQGADRSYKWPRSSTPKFSAIVIWTLEMKFRFHTGSNIPLAKRRSRISPRPILPRK